MVALIAKMALQALVIFAMSSKLFARSHSPSSDKLSSLSTSINDLSSNETLATATPYAILTKSGASLPRIYSSMAYHSIKIVHERTSFQGYCVNLTKAQVVRLSRALVVERILPTTPGDCLTTLKDHPPKSFDRRSSSSSESETSIPDAVMVTRPNSAVQLRLISDPGNLDSSGGLPDYYADSRLGANQDIYIVDDGFNIHHEELVGRVVGTHVVPNDIALKEQPDFFRPKPERANTIGEILIPSPDGRVPGGHGTMVASAAAGNTLGVASAANLFLIKDTALLNEYDGHPDHWKPVGMTAPILEDVWKYIRETVAERRRQPGHENRRSIITLSIGKSDESRLTPRCKLRVSQVYKLHLSFISDLYQRFLDWASSEDIVVVMSAGNSGYNEDGKNNILGSTWRLRNLMPQAFGTESNGVITVGGVDKFGQLDYQTTPSDGHGGSITVYALSDSPVLAKPGANEGNISIRGTTFAAGAVAGLAAYFFSLQSLQHQWHTGSVAIEMKEFIKAWARVRTRDPFDLQKRPEGYPLPPADSIIVAYNGAESGLNNKHDASVDEPSTESSSMDIDPGC